MSETTSIESKQFEKQFEKISQITEAVEESMRYPILTRDAGGSSASEAASRNGAGRDSSGLTSTARDTIREVLGWRFRADDPRGFVAALTKSFALREEEGQIISEYRPQTYAVSAELGEITGAQASIFNRARVAIDQSMLLLKGVTSLRNDTDEENGEATRAIIRTEAQELVQELGRVGGPRVQRVEILFDLLIGRNLTLGDPEKVRGYLRTFRNEFGLQRSSINTIAEEQNYTNYLILVDYLQSLKQTWEAQKRYFYRGKNVKHITAGEPFLGTQLVLISQALETLSESVQEAYAAMDSVFFGASERQTVHLDLPDEPPITVAELLNWIENFAAKEGRQLIQDAGKEGVVAFRRTVSRLQRLASETLKLSRHDSSNPVPAFHAIRSQSGFEGIVDGLQEVKELARGLNRLPPPRIDQIRVGLRKPDATELESEFTYLSELHTEIKDNPTKVAFEVHGGSFDPDVRLFAVFKGKNKDDVKRELREHWLNEDVVFALMPKEGEIGDWDEILSVTVHAENPDEQTSERYISIPAVRSRDSAGKK